MADFLPEHKEGGDDGKLNVVPLKDESTRLQCAPSEVCEDPHQNKESTLLHSSKLQQDECASVNLHPVEARSAKSCEETADNLGTLLGKDGNETAKTCKKQDDKIGLGVDESKLTKASLSQAKDPPDKENSQAKGKLTVTEQNESSPLEGASNEILSVSTKSSESPAPLNDNTSEDLPPCSLALPKTQAEGNMLISQQNESSPLEGASNEILSVSTKSSETSAAVNNTTTEDPPTCVPALPEAVPIGDVFEKSSSPTETGASIVGCQESLANLSKPTSLSTENSLVEDLDSSCILSNDTHQEKLTEALAESQGSSKSSMSFASLETAGIEGSSTQSSSMSSASDLCPENDVELNVVDASSHSSPLASVPKLSSTPIQTSSAQQEFGNKMELSLNQSQAKEIESHSQTSKVQCSQEYISAENESQDKVSNEKDGAVIEGDKSYTESEVQGDSGNLTVEIEIEAEQNQSWNDVSLTNEADTESLPMIVATRSLSQEEDAEKEFIGKGEQTPTVYTEIEATNMKIVLPLESEPLKPVTIGSSLQPLEEIQETPVVEETSFTTDMAIIDSSADEADSIGGLVINNVIGAADGVVDFQPDEVETEKELTDISASAPQLGEGSDSDDEHGPSAKRRRLENGPNSVEDKSKSAKKVIFKVIPVKNGHGVWDSQKLQEVLLTKGTILLQIHASDESMELCEPDKTDKTIDFTAIMAETKDDDHDHMLSFGNIDPDYHDPLSEGSSHPSYGRPFSHSHGRSTALQPAMSRPGFKHLQTPQVRIWIVHNE